MTLRARWLIVVALLFLAIPVQAEGPVKKVVPNCLVQMFNNEGVDLVKAHPGAGPIGSVQWCTWATVNPERGKFNWANVDSRLRAVAGMTVTLSSGEIISHPVILNIFPYLSSAYGQPSGVDFYDATPQWVYREMGDRPTVGGRLVGHKLTGCGWVAEMPAYDRFAWRDAFYTFIKAFGARYDGNPQVVGVVIGTGLDGETQPIKNYHCQWESIIDEQAPGVKYRFNEFWRAAMATYAAAFPTTQLWVDNVAGGSGTRKASSDLAATLGIGLQNSAMTTDIDSHTGYGGWTGQWDMPRAYSQTLSMNYETRMGYGSPETMYWTYLAGLHYHPDVLTVHPDYLTILDPALLGWMNGHIGVTLDDTPSVWCVLRDYEYPKTTWGPNSQEGASGAMGDWCFWMTRTKGGVRTFTVPDHPLYGRQARTTNQASGDTHMIFDVNDGFTQPAYSGRLVFVDQGADTLSLDWGAGKATYYKRGTGQWIEWRLPMPGYMPTNDVTLDCNSDGDETVHMLEVIGIWETVTATPTLRPTYTATATPRPTFTPSRTVTRTPTTTSTSSPQPTFTPTPSATPTPMPSPTGTPVLGTLSAICDNCLLVYDGERWLVPLADVPAGSDLVHIGVRLWSCRPGACDWSEVTY